MSDFKFANLNTNKLQFAQFITILSTHKIKCSSMSYEKIFLLNVHKKVWSLKWLQCQCLHDYKITAAFVL